MGKPRAHNRDRTSSRSPKPISIYHQMSCFSALLLLGATAGSPEDQSCRLPVRPHLPDRIVHQVRPHLPDRIVHQVRPHLLTQYSVGNRSHKPILQTPAATNPKPLSHSLVWHPYPPLATATPSKPASCLTHSSPSPSSSPTANALLSHLRASCSMNCYTPSSPPPSSSPTPASTNSTPSTPSSQAAPQKTPPSTLPSPPPTPPVASPTPDDDASNEFEKEREDLGGAIQIPVWSKESDRPVDEISDERVNRDKIEEGCDVRLAESLQGLNWNLLDSGEVRINVDIKDGGIMLLTALTLYANWLHGYADIGLQVSGTVEQPVLDGSAIFHWATVSSPVLWKPLTNFGGTVNVKSNRLCIASLESSVNRKGKLMV